LRDLGNFGLGPALVPIAGLVAAAGSMREFPGCAMLNDPVGWGNIKSAFKPRLAIAPVFWG